MVSKAGTFRLVHGVGVGGAGAEGAWLEEV